MTKTPMTQEQKEWYMIGFSEALVLQSSKELEVSKDTIRKWIIEELEIKSRERKKYDEIKRITTPCDCYDWRDMEANRFCPKCNGKGYY